MNQMGNVNQQNMMMNQQQQNMMMQQQQQQQNMMMNQGNMGGMGNANISYNNPDSTQNQGPNPKTNGGNDPFSGLEELI